MAGAGEYDPRSQCVALLTELAPVDDELALEVAGSLEEAAADAGVALTSSLSDFILSYGLPSLSGRGFPFDLAEALSAEQIEDTRLFSPTGWIARGPIRKLPCLYMRPFGVRTAALVGLPHLRTWTSPHEWIWVFHATNRAKGQIRFGPVGMSFWEAVFAVRTGIVDALYHPDEHTRDSAAVSLANQPEDRLAAIDAQLKIIGGMSYWLDNRRLGSGWLAHKERHGDSLLEQRLPPLLGETMFHNGCMASISIMEG